MEVNRCITEIDCLNNRRIATVRRQEAGDFIPGGSSVPRSCAKKETRRKQDIQDNRGNNRFSTLERASEIEAPFIRKRTRSPESRFNLMKILMKANIFAEDARQ